ncbi:MAG: hypothetical protein IJE51_06955 [Clostridia bacterium]|nr:hypothetical protein [Clostridia bacterium]
MGIYGETFFFSCEKKKVSPNPFKKEKQAWDNIRWLISHMNSFTVHDKSFFGKGLEKPIFTKNGFSKIPHNYQHKSTVPTATYPQFQTKVSTFIHRKKVFQKLSKEFERGFKFQKCGKILKL